MKACWESENVAALTLNLSLHLPEIEPWSSSPQTFTIQTELLYLLNILLLYLRIVLNACVSGRVGILRRKKHRARNEMLENAVLNNSSRILD